jgi:zinc/manganese transport system substrate-binding protein
MRRVPALPSVLLAAAVIVGLTSCTPASSEPDDSLSIVASTNVYADIARQVAGEAIEVTAIIDSSAKDPHEYEASAQDQLAVSKAAVLIQNGGGYDEFFTRLVDASGNQSARLIDAVEVSGFDTGDGELNEHVWYDFGTMAGVAETIGAELASLDPENGTLYRSNADAFVTAIESLLEARTTLESEISGTAVAVTEPLPVYLLIGLGLSDATPAAFSDAIEQGIDAPADVLQAVLRLFTSASVSLLIVNDQTTGPQTDAVGTAATRAGVPVIGMTETLPDGDDYQTWMAANIDAIGSALGH